MCWNCYRISRLSISLTRPFVSQVQQLQLASRHESGSSLRSTNSGKYNNTNNNLPHGMKAGAIFKFTTTSPSFKKWLKRAKVFTHETYELWANEQKFYYTYTHTHPHIFLFRHHFVTSFIENIIKKNQHKRWRTVARPCLASWSTLLFLSEIHFW